jgi:hypothetical protein
MFKLFRPRTMTKAEAFIDKDYLDDAGNAVIEVDLKDTGELFSQFSRGRMLNPAILNYLDTVADPIPNEHPLLINFVVDNRDKVNKEYVRMALKRYYWLSYENKKKRMRADDRNSVVLFVLGLAAFASGIIFKFDTGFEIVNSLFTEFSFLVSWIMLWESITSFIVGRKERLRDMYDEKQMAKARVIFTSRTEAKKNKKGKREA